MSSTTHGGRVHVEPVMGTTVTLDIRDSALSEQGLDTAIERAVALLHQADRVFSTWNTHSPLSQLRADLCELKQCPPDVLGVLVRCARAKELTRGWFDPWAMPGGLDPTGLVKGWAAQRALIAMAAAGVQHAMVNAGGDIAVLGSALADHALPGWNVAITNPHQPAEYLTVANLRRGGIATSGAYERGSLAIDPRSGKLVQRLASATVLADDLGLADACATAATAQGPAALDWLNDLNLHALLVTLDGTILTTRSWQDTAADSPRSQPALRNLRT